MAMGLRFHYRIFSKVPKFLPHSYFVLNIRVLFLFNRMSIITIIIMIINNIIIIMII